MKVRFTLIFEGDVKDDNDPNDLFLHYQSGEIVNINKALIVGKITVCNSYTTEKIKEKL